MPQLPEGNESMPRLQQARKAQDNAFIESFYGRLRDECLNQH